MNADEAREWIAGKRSMVNMIPENPRDTWVVRTCQADAAMMQQAYWCLRANAEGKEK